MTAAQKNTYNEGVLTFISYPTGEGTYVAACNELCLLVEEKDMQLARLNIFAKAKSYLKNVCTDQLGENLLNQSLPEEVISEYKTYVRKSLSKKKFTDEFEQWKGTWRKKSGKVQTIDFLTAA